MVSKSVVVCLSDFEHNINIMLAALPQRNGLIAGLSTRLCFLDGRSFHEPILLFSVISGCAFVSGFEKIRMETDAKLADS